MFWFWNATEESLNESARFAALVESLPNGAPLSDDLLEGAVAGRHPDLARELESRVAELLQRERR